MNHNHFHAPWWLGSPHLQTVWGRLTRPRAAVPLERETLQTPDDDDLIVDHLVGAADTPRLILLHGLEGSSQSVYIQGLLSLVAAKGWAATAINFRSCARDPRDRHRMLPNRRPRFYHSGETGDLDFVIRTLRAREPGRTLLAFGASLGGNVVLKWLGEHPGSDWIAAAATISVPYDLGAGARFLETTIGGLYVGSFLRTLRPKAFSVLDRFLDAPALDREAVRRASTFRQFDDAATAPLHGFAGADDYYRRASSIGFVDRITVPTLCISAMDDPFLPANTLEEVRMRLSPSVTMVITAGGGHVGFIGGRVPWRPLYWAEQSVADWLGARAAGAHRQRMATRQ